MCSFEKLRGVLLKSSAARKLFARPKSYRKVSIIKNGTLGFVMIGETQSEVEL